VTPLATAGSQLFVASDEVYRANTLGGSWTQVSGGLGSSASVITTDMRGMLTPTYVGTSAGKIFFSADAGIASPVFSDVTGNFSGGRVSDIAMDPVNAQRVFLTRAGFGAARLYRSTSGGTSWTAVGNGLPNVPANAVAIDPLDANRIFVGTDIGVYQSTDGGDNFTAFSAGLPLGLVVTDLEIDDLPHVLTAGTYSRGAWRLILNGSAGNSAPTADFEATANGLDVAFSDLSIDLDGSIVGHNWDFGDGSAASTEPNPQHTYPAPGSYTVLLQVTDDDAASSSFAKIVRINRAPVALTNGGGIDRPERRAGRATAVHPGGSSRSHQPAL
jgi:PKD repeat protein